MLQRQARVERQEEEEKARELLGIRTKYTTI